MRLIAFVVGIFVLFGAGGIAAAAPPSFQLARARAEFERGEYQRVIDTLAPELYPKLKIANTEELKEAHYLLGSAYFFLNRTELAKQEFTALLFIDPSRDLDPAIDPPRVYAFFQTLKQELADKLRDIQSHRAPDPPSREVIIERTIVEPTVHLSHFLPFGYGQFKNGQPGKGAFFLITEAIFGGASIGLFTYQAATYGIPSHYTADQKDTLNILRVGQLVSGGLFLAIYGVGVYDAYANQKLVVDEKRSVRPLTPPLPAPVQKTSWQVVPLLSPQGIGVGAVGRF